ncbi:MAG: phosphatidylserine decarboxylase [Candidatus Aminicenantes bacterium]|nr:phosphatidylserine decarboxylase [Candidatus Aminicenantes bacterium]
MTIGKEGLKFILPSAGLAVLFGALPFWPAAVFFLLLAAAFTFFFRDPRRTPPEGDHLLVSPADGEVLAIDALPAHSDLPGPVNRVTIFLSILDVHFVRSPLAGTVSRMDYNPGRFLPAYKPEAGDLNESRTMVLKGGKSDLVMKMIVGVAARRIKSYVKEGQAVDRGRKVGLMYFGSRVEIFLPREVSVRAAPRQKVKGGETVIAEVRS